MDRQTKHTHISNRHIAKHRHNHTQRQLKGQAHRKKDRQRDIEARRQTDRQMIHRYTVHLCECL